VHISTDKQYGGHVITVAPTGLSKWAGVVAYCSRAGLDPERVLAIGDGPNDRELLTRAAVAVIPEDADETLRGAGHHVVGSARTGGWAEILDLI
ncbi:MAG TPA: HAD hydrolase family protein, partial [Acidimicrobiia bacterium]